MKKDTYIMIRVSNEDKAFLQTVAKKNKLSLSNYVMIAAINKAKRDNK